MSLASFCQSKAELTLGHHGRHGDNVAPVVTVAPVPGRETAMMPKRILPMDAWANTRIRKIVAQRLASRHQAQHKQGELSYQVLPMLLSLVRSLKAHLNNLVAEQ